MELLTSHIFSTGAITPLTCIQALDVYHVVVLLNLNLRHDIVKTFAMAQRLADHEEASSVDSRCNAMKRFSRRWAYCNEIAWPFIDKIGMDVTYLCQVWHNHSNASSSSTAKWPGAFSGCVLHRDAEAKIYCNRLLE